jgi:ornithine cyclodeaminase/alanine dehydrogenase-like protein (mu-crystallin family)
VSAIQLAVIDAQRTRDLLPFATLIPALTEAFAGEATVPARHHHNIPQGNRPDGVLLLMPAWQESGYLGVKIANIFPGNVADGLPAVHSAYLLCDAATGSPLAMLDGNEVTGLRTVGVAALGASYLARPDASSLMIVGSGRIAQDLAQAFAAVRPIQTVTVWSRTLCNAEALVSGLRADGFNAHATPDLEGGVRQADIVSCATLSTSPLIRGDWLRPGAHLDLIGSFTPQMREADDACVLRGRIFIDTSEAVAESGDLVQPLQDHVIDDGDIVGTLSELCSGRLTGRNSEDEITIFKAVGTARADLAAGALAYRSFRDAAA